MNEYVKHVIKYDYEDGVKLSKPILWCGQSSKSHEWYFQDAQHAAHSKLSQSRLVPCDKCCQMIVECLRK